MVDFLNAEERSARMAAVKQKNTAPELMLRRELHRVGLRYRLHARDLPGSPDIVFPRFKSVVFVHGCYWHRHEGCNATTTPKTNLQFWLEKFQKNIERDKRKHKELIDLGWKVYIVWQCEISTQKKAESKANELSKNLIIFK